MSGMEKIFEADDARVRASGRYPNDILFGALKMFQPADGAGPRVNMDTVLLAHYARIKPRSRVVEMGCAHGAVSIILSRRTPSARIDAFDINRELIDMARENARLNSAGGVSFFVSDLRGHRENFRPESYDAVVMNPPYDEPGRCRPSSDAAMASAMHGGACTLSEVVRCAKYLLRNRGKFFLVMRAKRIAELFSLLHEHNVRPKRFRMVHPKPGRDASVALVEAARASGDGVMAEPPLFVYGPDGEYTEQLLAAYRI
ncbi:MAG: methyltransferase [Synergistaceae bacterium]|jgi:tRNA1(Val) A37 N6-methylase TrmN6|nr:methyltransferase [Synergistaceae bacterium]